MSYIKFEKSQIVNLEYSLTREILRTNRAGSYTSTTIVECNTRKYHGLLICPVDTLGGGRYLLLSGLDVTVVNNDRSFNIGIRKYKGDYFNPRGHKYIEELETEIIPTRTYRVGNVLLKMERLFVHDEEQLLIRYTILDATEPMKLQIRPFLAFRSIHELTHANLAANTRIDKIKNGIRSKLYEGFPFLNLQFSRKADFVHVPDWYLGVEYIEEQKRGYDYSEDLFTPGFFELDAVKGNSIVFSASTKEEDPSGFEKKFSDTVAGKIPRNSYLNCLRNAAQQFVEKRGDDTLIIAGYPWFGSWGRDTFISLPGLALARHRVKLYEAVFDTQVRRMKDGLFPNLGTGGNYAFNSIDAPLWFFWALQQYVLHGGQDCCNKYSEAAKSVLYAYKNGTAYNIHMRDDGLIYADAPGKALTWMDAVVYGVPVTPRNGYAVEINALWYNAVCFALEMAKVVGDKQFIKDFGYLPGLIKRSFIDLFWDEKAGYLADYVNDQEGRNMFVRPNMVIAVSLPYSMLEKDQMKRILDIADKELVTPRGLRTLSPGNRFYKGIYSGNQEERDKAYHQGTVWPWLFGPFCEGWLKVYGRQGVSKIKKLIYGLEDVMSEAGITTLSEIHDGDPPHAPRGSISQAWSVGEVLRIIDLLEEYSDKK
ncbi:MAG TPA: amylo-alpha-1,6-glucosidase [Bacteroidales bacterium]|jgi:predicted glycogen debranching enzyme|nr:amylo-alpha-1,6-glucosidase [Bacteroidales bacterium]HOX73380.1 amylo-alpha-1,6-glucosidase [Bacteroidales bacterium]HPM87588.1 amylo-alpha-1,6-glucosidase [Bacteroidales bacterium]HQM69451.1 amylo-alpha-1,6-glucosidase [Bacteroidales bacterium]